MTLGEAVANNERDIAGLEIQNIPAKARNMLKWLDQVDEVESNQDKIDVLREMSIRLAEGRQLDVEFKKKFRSAYDDLFTSGRLISKQ